MLPLTVDQGVVGCAAGIVDPGEVTDADGAALSVPHRDNPGQGIKSLCIVKVGQCTGLGADPLIELAFQFPVYQQDHGGGQSQCDRPRNHCDGDHQPPDGAGKGPKLHRP